MENEFRFGNLMKGAKESPSIQLQLILRRVRHTMATVKNTHAGIGDHSSSSSSCDMQGSFGAALLEVSLCSILRPPFAVLAEFPRKKHELARLCCMKVLALSWLFRSYISSISVISIEVAGGYL